MKSLKYIFICFVTLLASNSYADTQPPWYQVELIVFEQANTDSLASEAWPANLKFSLPRNMQELTKLPKPVVEDTTAAENTNASALEQTNDELTPTDEVATTSPEPDTTVATTPIEFQQLPVDKFQLAVAKQKLIDANYKILLHTAWQQPIPDHYRGKAIHIFGGNAYDAEGNILNKEQLAATTNPFWQVNGSLRITRSRYFNLRTNLLLSENVDNLSASIPQTYIGNFSIANLRNFVLHETRRTRANELNYLDHPLFGVLVKIIPVEAPPTAAPTEVNTIASG